MLCYALKSICSNQGTSFIDYRDDLGTSIPPSSLWSANGNIGFSPGLPSEMGEPRKATENSGREDTLPPHVKVIQQLFSLSDYFYII